jgi:4-amino-4-deoxy-L-arabinose transferase-like glycosyltransferase
MKREGIIYIGFILGAVLISLVVYLGALRGELGLYEVILSVVALLLVASSYYVYMRLPQFRELERRLQALAAENRKLRENNSVLKEQVELFKSVEK